MLLLSEISFQIHGHSDVAVMNASHQKRNSPVSEAYCVQLEMKNDIRGSTSHTLLHHS